MSPSTASEGDPFPIRMEPRETLNLTTWYAVTDCAQITRTDVDDTDVDLQVRIADGPIASITRTRTIHADGGLSGDEGTIAEGRVDSGCAGAGQLEVPAMQFKSA